MQLLALHILNDSLLNGQKLELGCVILVCFVLQFILSTSVFPCYSLHIATIRSWEKQDSELNRWNVAFL